MYYKFKAQKDSYVDSKLRTSNFGKDEILEIGRPLSASVVYPKRALIKFNMTEISSSWAAGTIDSGSTFELKLYEAENGNLLNDEFWVDVHAISTVWTEGTGSLYNDHKSGSVCWISASVSAPWTSAGGDYAATPSCSQYFTTASGDMSIDVTTLVSQSVAGLITYEGFMIKLRDESSLINQNPKTMFSKDTDTIYEPVLYAKWNDIASTGSVTASAAYTTYTINLRNPKTEYSKNEKPYFELYIRNAYPTLTFSTTVASISTIPLTGLSYQIVDRVSGDTVIPFSAYTSCSYDASKSYFYIEMQALEPNRSYDLELKHSFLSTKEVRTLHTFRIID